MIDLLVFIVPLIIRNALADCSQQLVIPVFITNMIDR